jgi:hypothetical protein
MVGSYPNKSTATTTDVATPVGVASPTSVGPIPAAVFYDYVDSKSNIIQDNIENLAYAVQNIKTTPGPIGPIGPIGPAAPTVYARPEDYGAIGDGTSHKLSSRFLTLGLAQAYYSLFGVSISSLNQEIDWAACQAAATVNNAVNFSGKYYLGSNKITTANKAITYICQGTQITKFISSGGGVFSHTDNRPGGAGANQRGTFTLLGGATLVSTVAYGGTAIFIDMRTQGAVLANAVYGGPVSVVIGPGLQIVGNSDFQGQGTDFWTIGIDLVDTGTVYIDSPNILGAFTKVGTRGLRISNSTGANTEFYIKYPVIHYVEVYIEIIANSRTLEGVYVTSPSCVGARVAILLTGGVIHSLRVDGGHLDAKEAIIKADSNTRGSAGWMIQGLFAQLSSQYDGTFSSTGAIFDLDTQASFQSLGCHFISFNPSKVQTGARAAGCTRSMFSNNKWLFFAKVFDFPNNSSGGLAELNKADGTNTYEACTSICDDPVANSNNYVERSGVGWSEFVTGREIRSEIISVTTDSDGVVAIPFKKQLHLVPTTLSAQVASFSNATALNYNVICDSDTATVDSFRIVLRNSSGSGPGSITFKIAYTATVSPTTRVL